MQSAVAPFRIDVHHHPAVPSHTAAMIAGGVTPLKSRLGWTPGQSLEDMDRAGVATAMLSLPQPPGIWPREDVAKGRALARAWNEELARLREDHPGRFGVFAALPIRDVEGSLLEIEYALDTLRAEGINLMTNFGAKWLGDAHYEPLFAELDRRKAVVYTHPVTPSCCWNIIPEIDSTVLEYGFDTTRAIAKLIFTGAAARYPGIRFIFSHAGGTMPFLVERFERAPISTGKDFKAQAPYGILHELKKFYYDTAQAAHPLAVGVLAKLVATSQIVFGTDFPFRSSEEQVRSLNGCGFGENELRAIYRENALRLMPGLVTAGARAAALE
jgi:predicted TIM-barrel fold metal-dependent hydrolase